MLKLTGVSKSFPGVRALRDVSFEIQPGEIHALVGENGAGKSTLIKTIAGAIRPEEGQVIFDGKPLDGSPRETKARGIHVVYQEFVLFPHLTVAENLFMGQERRNALGLVDRRRMHRESKLLLEKIGVDVDPRRLVAKLHLHEKVAFLEGVSESELQWCYVHCQAVVSPSTVEGFGLPIAEALLAGCRIVCSDIPSFREVGDGSGSDLADGHHNRVADCRLGGPRGHG